MMFSLLACWRWLAQVVEPRKLAKLHKYVLVLWELLQSHVCTSGARAEYADIPT